jgi:hypothetical protein
MATVNPKDTFFFWTIGFIPRPTLFIILNNLKT